MKSEGILKFLLRIVERNKKAYSIYISTGSFLQIKIAYYFNVFEQFYLKLILFPSDKY